ncbi:hypothetical protein D5282_18425 [bacterium 1xD8-48]|nr:hypothetical protein [bacterium 1xD8-48]
MVKIQKCRRHGVCNDCGRQQDENVNIWEVKASSIGQGWTTLMFCRDCLAALNAAIAITVFDNRI